MKKNKNFRYIDTGKYQLSQWEFDNLYNNYGIDCEDYYVLIPLTKEEFKLIREFRRLK